MIDAVYRHCGQKESVIFCDRIMKLGFYNAFKAGISFGKDDMVIPENKWEIVEETRALAKDYEQQYQDGLITQGEKYNKVVDAWAKCSDRLAGEMMNRISAVKKDEDGRDKPVNSIYMMSHSGARGSPAQMKQLAAMRGLMAKPSGEIIETPIISNFKEGLDVLEYFNSTHGARKGLADTALKTANSGYLTRRLVDVAQDAVIRETDCGTERGIRMRAIIDAGQVVASLGSRILGRSTAEDLVDIDGEVIVPKGTMIEEQHLEAITAAGIQEVKIRSVLVCESKNGVCATCYGRDLARGTPVNHGEAVGVIAAQSIGEPGTQLTMRTFHIGGAAQIADSSFFESNFEGTISFRNKNIARNSDGDLIVMGRNVAVVITGPDGAERSVHRLQYGSRLKVDEGDTIKRGQRIAEWDPYTRPILTEIDGVVGYEDLVDGASMIETMDESTGIAKRVVIDWRGSARTADLRPAVIIEGKGGKIAKLARGGDARYLLPVDAILAVDPGSKVKAGDVLARVSTESAKTRDITGGLPRVAELFEARRPKDAAIIAEKSGTIQFGRDYKNKRRLTLNPHDGSEAVEYLIPKGKHIHLQDGDVVEIGDFIVDGNPAPHDILAIKGVEELAAYLVERDPGGLPPPGRAHQRQAHRGDRPADAAEGRDHRRRRLRAADRRAGRPARAGGDQRAHGLREEEARRRRAGSARHHQGVAADPLLHLGGVQKFQETVNGKVDTLRLTLSAVIRGTAPQTRASPVDWQACSRADERLTHLASSGGSGGERKSGGRHLSRAGLNGKKRRSTVRPDRQPPTGRHERSSIKTVMCECADDPIVGLSGSAAAEATSDHTGIEA